MQLGKFIEHPEGGRYQEVFRSASEVLTALGQKRHALTHIYFSLDEGEVSKFHKVLSDEVWNLYRGVGLTLYLWDDNTGRLSSVELSSAGHRYCFVVEAGLWQAAKPLAGSVLVGCSVAPGFEFEDFELLDHKALLAGRILDQHPELSVFV